MVHVQLYFAPFILRPFIYNNFRVYQIRILLVILIVMYSDLPISQSGKTLKHFISTHIHITYATAKLVKFMTSSVGCRIRVESGMTSCNRK